MLYCVLLLWEHCQFPYVPCTVQHHCMFHNVPHTVQHYLQVSVSLTHFTTCHFLFYNALYLLLVLQYPLYSSTLPAVLHCPSLSSVHPASFVMSLIQFSTPCQFLKCPSFRSILPATCAMSLIQFNTPCHLCSVPHSIQHFLSASRSSLCCLKVSMPIHTLALLAVFRSDVTVTVLQLCWVLIPPVAVFDLPVLSASRKRNEILSSVNVRPE